MASRKYLALVARVAVRETTKVWNVHRFWLSLAPLPAGVLMGFILPTGEGGRLASIVLGVLSSLGVAYAGSFVINVVRAPKLLYEELLGGGKPLAALGRHPIVVLSYRNVSHLRMHVGLRNEGDGTAYNICVQRLTLGSYEATFEIIPELARGQSIMPEVHVTNNGRSCPDNLYGFLELLLCAGKSSIPLNASFRDRSGIAFHSHNHFEISGDSAVLFFDRTETSS